MSTQGRGRRRVCRKVRELPTTITGGQPSYSTPPISIPGIESHLGSPTSTAAHSPGGQASSRTRAHDRSPAKDSQGRIIVSISIARQFIGGPPIVSHWYKEMLRTRVTDSYSTLASVPQKVREQLWEELKTKYCWPGHTDEYAQLAFKDLCEACYKDTMEDITKYCWQAGKPKLPCYSDDICAHQNDPKEKENSERNKKNRASKSGSGTKHTMGSINHSEHHSRMYAYERVHDVEIAEGRLKSTGTSAHLSSRIWGELSSAGRKKRRQRVFEFGEHGAGMLNPSLSEYSTQSSRSTARYPVEHEASLDEQVQEITRLVHAALAEQNTSVAELKQLMAEQQRIMDLMRKRIQQQQHQRAVVEELQAKVAQHEQIMAQHGQMVAQHGKMVADMEQKMLTVKQMEQTFMQQQQPPSSSSPNN